MHGLEVLFFDVHHFCAALVEVGPEGVRLLEQLLVGALVVFVVDLHGFNELFLDKIRPLLNVALELLVDHRKVDHGCTERIGHLVFQEVLLVLLQSLLQLHSELIHGFFVRCQVLAQVFHLKRPILGAFGQNGEGIPQIARVALIGEGAAGGSAPALVRSAKRSWVDTRRLATVRHRC